MQEEQLGSPHMVTRVVHAHICEDQVIYMQWAKPQRPLVQQTNRISMSLIVVMQNKDHFTREKF